jgi:hypothetical protein
MKHPFPDPRHPGESAASTLWALGIGLFVAVWVLWSVLSPGWSSREAAETRGTSADPKSVIIPVEPRLPGIDLERATRLLVEAVVQIESHGDPKKVGGVGERGLMQIRESTWEEVTSRHYGKPIPFDRAFEPELNRQVGRLYLGDLQAFLYRNQPRWKSDLRSLLLASYNAGPDRVRKAGFDVEKLPAVVRSYAERGSNLHDWYLKQDAEKLKEMMADQQRASQAE